ncbi:glycoside hydrolase family 5 protein [Geminicoccus roseus]|uniref:glycoside hydrolase family 5 protein n=1 Tax=Geminicoccus roseus TaxID=404900 RepID=UPI0004207BC0|nr:glycoside hydrolase family 5 protein [Geminicoccus roseus]
MSRVQGLLFAILLSIVVGCSGTPTVAATSNPIPPGYLKTYGNKIRDMQNHNIRILGVNWFGFETETMTPHGLWARNYKSMISQIASMGFNTIRLPFSLAMLSGTVADVGGVHMTLNQEFQNKTPLQIMDAVIAYAGQEGLRVLLDMHSIEPDENQGKWYSATRTEADWINGWKFLAARYANNPTVIGADLFNEPSGAWGTGAADDWARAATAAGNAIHTVNNKWLIVVEGVRYWNNTWYWWGGGLQAVATMPIVLNTPNKVVYSPHDYPPSLHEQPWYQDPNYPNNLPAVWESHWGFIETQNIAPILLGEFGSGLATTRDNQWADTLAAYIKSEKLDWAYFAFNANGQPTMGVLNPDWTTLNPSRQTYLLNLISNTKI